MSLAVALAAGILGLFAGSAIWVIASAQSAGRPLFSGPTCPTCAKPLPATAWLPLFGLSTTRYCRECDAGLPVLRLLFEGAVAVYFALAAWRLGATQDLAETLVFSAPLLIIFLVDWWTRFIHTQIIGIGVLAGLAFAVLDGRDALLNAVFSAAVAVALFAFFFALASLIYRNLKVVPFGVGDVYLAAMIATMTRYPGVVSALFFGVLFAALASIFLLLIRRVGRRDPIPYGPYLCAGALLILVVR